MTRPGRMIVAACILAVLAAVGVALWQRRIAARAESELGIASTRVLSATFARASALKVAGLSGEVLAQSKFDGCYGWCQSQQTTRAPYSVNYFVQVGGLTAGAFRWNARERVMYIDVPDVTTERPNVDMAHAQIRQNGAWISRSAGAALQSEAAVLLSDAAARKAADPRYVQQARASARLAMAQLVRAPLAAAGLGQIRVEVRFPDETRPEGVSREQWDVSRSIAEVLADRAGR